MMTANSMFGCDPVRQHQLTAVKINAKLKIMQVVLLLLLMVGFTALADSIKVYVTYNGRTAEIQEITDVSVLEQAANSVQQELFGCFSRGAIQESLTCFKKKMAIDDRIDWINAGGDSQKFQQIKALRMAREQASTQLLQQQNMMMQQLMTPQPMQSVSSSSSSAYGQRTNSRQGYCSLHQCTFTYGIGMGGGCPKCNTAKYSGGNYYTCPKCHKTCEDPFGHPCCK